MAKARKNVWERNFAEDAAVRELVKDQLIARARQVRDDRTQLEDEWMRYFNMWNVTKDGSHTYTGRANLYIPEVRKNVEAQARQLTKAAFPNDDFFDVSVGPYGTKKGAKIWKSIQRFNIERAKLRPKYHVFQRQSCLYGTSPALVAWDRRTETAFKSAYDRKRKVIVPKRQLVELYNGPTFKPRDLFRWYTLNPKKEDLEDGCFEDNPVSFYDLLRKAKADALYGIEDIKRGGSLAMQMDELQRDIERAEALNLPIDNSGYAGEASLQEDGDRPESRGYVLTTMFAKIVLPQACEKDEDPELPIPLLVEWVNGEHVTMVRRNPFFHQRPPYVVGKYILPNVDEFHGQGIPKAIQYMQYEINSKIEQAMDSATLALNPIAFIDPALAAQFAEYEIAPGAQWFVSPQGVKFGAVPDVTPTAYAAVSQLRNQIADFSDRAPALPPQLAGKSRTATQSEFVYATLSVDNEAFQMQNEEMVLQPLLEQWESLFEQNADEKQIVMILGNRASDWKKMLVRKQDILGNYSYFWKAASVVQNKPIVARQVLDSIKLVLTLPPEERARVGFRMDEAVKMLFSELWNLPDGDKLFGTPEDMKSQDPTMEHEQLGLGFELEVLPGDDDVQHLSAHGPEISRLKKANKLEDADALAAHSLQHARQRDAKVEAVKKAQAMQAQMIAAQAAAANPGAKKGIGSGNRTQMSPAANTGDMASGVRP